MTTNEVFKDRFKPKRIYIEKLKYIYAQVTEMFRNKPLEYYRTKIKLSNIRISELESCVERLSIKMQLERENYEKILDLYKLKLNHAN